MKSELNNLISKNLVEGFFAKKKYISNPLMQNSTSIEYNDANLQFLKKMHIKF